MNFSLADFWGGAQKWGFAQSRVKKTKCFKKSLQKQFCTLFGGGGWVEGGGWGVPNAYSRKMPDNVALVYLGSCNLLYCDLLGSCEVSSCNVL